MGCSCSTVVEHKPSYQEVVGLKSTKCWAPFLLLLSFPIFLHQWSVLNQVPQVGASLTMCCERKKWMPSCAAWGKTGSIGSHWIKKATDSMFWLRKRSIKIFHGSKLKIPFCKNRQTGLLPFFGWSSGLFWNRFLKDQVVKLKIFEKYHFLQLIDPAKLYISKRRCSRVIWGTSLSYQIDEKILGPCQGQYSNKVYDLI